MTAIDAPVVEPAPRAASGWFKVGQLTEAAIVRFGANPASLYLLLCKRVNYTGAHAGRSAQPYCHTTVAALFGCSRRHLYDCLKTLVDGGAVAIQRTRDGHHVTILGYPSPQSRWEPPCSSDTAPEQTGTPVPVRDEESGTPVPVRTGTPVPVPIHIQESKNQEGGNTTTVDRATSPARSVPDLPPPVEYVEKLEPARTAIEKELGRPLDDLDPGIHSALCWQLHRLKVPPESLAAGARLATVRLKREPQHLTKPFIWVDRVKEESLAYDAQARSRERQRQESAPPADRERDEEAYARSRLAAEAARQALRGHRAQPGAAA